MCFSFKEKKLVFKKLSSPYASTDSDLEVAEERVTVKYIPIFKIPSLRIQCAIGKRVFAAGKMIQDLPMLFPYALHVIVSFFLKILILGL